MHANTFLNRKHPVPTDGSRTKQPGKREEVSDYVVKVTDSEEGTEVNTSASSPLEALSSVISVMKESEGDWQLLPLSLTVSEAKEVAEAKKVA